MARWKETQPKNLKKIVYGLTINQLKNYIKTHEERGWKTASDIKEHHRGVAVLMTWGKDVNKHASNS
ncbi:hypothetical protein ACWE42_14705 [Sutcliffiella cohnii]